jgi:hypothetical protein
MDTPSLPAAATARRLWNLDVNSAISRICTVAGKDLTPTQWQTVRSRPMNAIPSELGLDATLVTSADHR